MRSTVFPGTDVAMISTGAILVAWSDYRNNNDDIYFANSTDGGTTWTNPNIRINTDGGSEHQNDPSIAVAPDDTVEAAVHRELEQWGVMWHPERPPSGEPELEILRALFVRPAGS